MRCFYNTGNKLCDFLGEFLNGAIWVHSDKNGDDWGVRVFIHSVSVDDGVKGIEIHIADKSKRAIAVHVILSQKVHEWFRAKNSGDNGVLMSWEGLKKHLARNIRVIDGVSTKRVVVSGVWRSPMYGFEHVADDAIHVVPAEDGTSVIYMEQWMIDVLAEEGIIDRTW